MMLSSRMRARVWLAQHKVDFRKQHQGLLAEAYKMGLDPFAGDVIIFVGRTRRMLKVLYSDPTGLFVTAKLFTLGTIKTRFKFLTEAVAKDITMAELSLLIEGSRYTIEKRVAPYAKPVDRRGDSFHISSTSREDIDERSPIPSRAERCEGIS